MCHSHPKCLSWASFGNLYSCLGLKLKIICLRHTHTPLSLTSTLPGMRTYAYLPMLSLKCCTGMVHFLLCAPLLEKDPMKPLCRQHRILLSRGWEGLLQTPASICLSCSGVHSLTAVCRGPSFLSKLGSKGGPGVSQHSLFPSQSATLQELPSLLS